MERFSQVFLMKANDAIDAINDPAERIRAIALMMPFADVTMPEETVVSAANTNSIIAEEVKEPAPKKKVGRKSKAESKPAEEPVVQQAEATAEEIAKPVEQVEAAEEPVKVEAKPLEMVQPNPHDVAEIQAAVEDIVIKEPGENDTEEEVAARRAAIVKKYGDKTIEDVYQDAELQKLLSPEIDGVIAFKDFLMSFYGIEINEDGTETSSSDMTSNDVSELVQHFIAECDEAAEDSGKVRVSNFITKALDYLQNLYYIYYFYVEHSDVVIEAGRFMSDSNDFALEDVNICNAGALRPMIQERLAASGLSA